MGLISSTAAGGPPAPIIPVRQRHNPFNLMERETSASFNAKSVIKKQTFAEVHTEYGMAIILARDLWKKNDHQQFKQDEAAAVASLIKEDVLITL